MNLYYKRLHMKPSKFYSYFMIMCLLSLLFFFPLTSTFPSARPQCHSAEHAALLQFKESFITDCRYASPLVPSTYPKVASWKLEGNGSDCCSWDGVECDVDTGHVIGLDLNASCLYGSMDSNSSLFRLLHLQYLNLAYNNFNRSRIPPALGNLSALNHLQLSNSQFFGQIPSEISKLSKLSNLDLSSSSYQHGIYPSEKLVELKNPGLRSLVQNMSSLEYLHLGFVDISSRISDILANLSSLRSLSLHNCGLQGSIPISIFTLKNLERLNVYSNNLTGIVDLDSFLPLKNLQVLHLSFSNLVFLDKTSNNETLPVLTELGLASCSLSAFPLFLCKQNKLLWLNLSWNNLHGKIPSWIWGLSLGTMEGLLLSNNYLTSLGLSPSLLPWPYLRILDLSSNLLEGPLPIPPFSTTYYSVSNNSFSGEIPEFICKVSSLEVLDLSRNNLNGPIPRCLGNFSSSLSILNLESNKLYGTIPPAWTQNSIRMISLGQNKLEGQIPRSLASCKMLEILDLGNNQLNDTFPSWMGTLPEFKVLILRWNMFHGKTGSPETSFSFRKLQILDLSSNNFTGKLPVEYFLCGNAMQEEDDEDQLKYMQVDRSLTIQGELVQSYYVYSMTMTNKGIEMDYSRIVRTLRALDFSCNKFEGGIPVLIGNIKGLRLLNLSNNILSGLIPASIGNLTKLEALDLSQNRLSGAIPQQLVRLTFLEVFNVSYNHLIGRIPRGKQFDTFQNNSFDGNPGLCGEPLSGTYCEDPKALPPAPPPISDESFGLDWKFVLIGYAIGFVFGAVIGRIVIERKCEWVVKFFRVRQPRRQRRTRRRHGN